MVTNPDAVYAFLGWAKGHFEFAMGDPGEGSPIGWSFDQLLLEGCRRLNEAGRDPAVTEHGGKADLSA